jgi:hypothetical protein
MPKPSIYRHRFYLLKFTEFDPHQRGFLPSPILNDPDTMPKPRIKEHRLYLLKFAEFDPPLKGFLPSLILSMTLTLCQNPASMNRDFALSNLTEINPCWKKFVPSQIHRL